MKLDRTDLAILELLQGDCQPQHRRHRRAAQPVPVTLLAPHQPPGGGGPDPAARRLLDRDALGMDVVVFATVNLTATGRQNLLSFEQEIVRYPEVMECYTMTGIWDYMLKIVTRDIRHYEQLRARHAQRQPGRARTALAHGGHGNQEQHRPAPADAGLRAALQRVVRVLRPEPALPGQAGTGPLGHAHEAIHGALLRDIHVAQGSGVPVPACPGGHTPAPRHGTSATSPSRRAPAAP
jgi:Lrp/AsnC family transcriptional regulator